MDPTRSAKPTFYGGVMFRSRLEAKWAAFFDLVGWTWVYEPIDTGGYIPDFLIQGRHPLFVEVGPCITEADFRSKATKADARASELRHDVLVVGVTPLPGLQINGSGCLAAGWMGEVFDGPDGPELSWDCGVWGGDLGDIGVYHSVMSYLHRPHGGRSEDPLYPGSDHWLRETWGQASNATQWQPR